MNRHASALQEWSSGVWQYGVCVRGAVEPPDTSKRLKKYSSYLVGGGGAVEPPDTSNLFKIYSADIIGGAGRSSLQTCQNY